MAKEVKIKVEDDPFERIKDDIEEIKRTENLDRGVRNQEDFERLINKMFGNKPIHPEKRRLMEQIKNATPYETAWTREGALFIRDPDTGEIWYEPTGSFTKWLLPRLKKEEELLEVFPKRKFYEFLDDLWMGFRYNKKLNPGAHDYKELIKSKFDSFLKDSKMNEKIYERVMDLIKDKQREVLKKKYPRCIINRDPNKDYPEFREDGVTPDTDGNRMADYVGTPLDLGRLLAELGFEVRKEFGIETKE